MTQVVDLARKEPTKVKQGQETGCNDSSMVIQQGIPDAVGQ
jgi:hypothetical protein